MQSLAALVSRGSYLEIIVQSIELSIAARSVPHFLRRFLYGVPRCCRSHLHSVAEQWKTFERPKCEYSVHKVCSRRCIPVAFTREKAVYLLSMADTLEARFPPLASSREACCSQGRPRLSNNRRIVYKPARVCGPLYLHGGHRAQAADSFSYSCFPTEPRWVSYCTNVLKYRSLWTNTILPHR